MNAVLITHFLCISQNATAKAALQAAQQVTMGGTDSDKKVLRVIVENLVYPVTIDVLHTVSAIVENLVCLVTIDV